MKQMYLVNNSQGLIRTLAGLKSRITPTRPLLNHYCTLTVVLLLLLGGFSTRAYADGNTWTVKVGIGTSSVGRGSAYAQIYSDAVSPWNGVQATTATATTTSLQEASWTSDYNTTKAHCIYTATASAGYHFVAWYTNVGCTSGEKSGSTYNGPSEGGEWKTGWLGSKYWGSTNKTYTYYAKFEPNTYDVTLNPNGGSGSNQTVQATFDAAMPTTLKAGGAIVKPTRDGYTFVGYYDAQTNGTKYYNADLTSAKNWDKDQTGAINLYAHWTANKYNVVFNGNGSNGGSMSKQEFTYGAASTALTANGFTRVYTVSYNANGGTTATTTTANTTATYTFDHWNTQANNGGTNYANQASVQNLAYSGDFNLFAQWTSGSVTLPTATRENHVIEGWYNGSTDVPANKVGVPGDSYTPTTNVNLTAKWIARYPFTMSGSDHTMEVGDVIENAFTFTYAEDPEAVITQVSIATIHSDNNKVIEYDAEHNKLIAHNAGTAKIYFAQDEKETIQEGTSTEWTITVNKIANTLTVASNAYNPYIDATISNVTSNKNSDATVTTTSSNSNLARFVVDDNQIVIPNSDALTAPLSDVTITISQAETYKYTAKNETITVSPKKIANTFTVASNSYSKNVGEVVNTIVSNKNSNATVTTSSSNSTLARYVVDDNQIIVPNSDAQKLPFSPVTITISQAETYKYTAKNETITVMVSKLANALSCKFDNVTSTTWKKTLNFDEYTVATFSSNHTTNAIQVALKVGDSIASYNPSNGRITASCNIGDAIWTVWQPENYMYVGDTAECKVTVDTKTCPTCYAYKNDPDKEASKVNEVGWDINGIANVLTFDMKKNGTMWGDNALLSWWITDHYTTPIEVTADNLSSYKSADPNPIQLDPHTTKLKFEKGGDLIQTFAGDVHTDDPYINNIRVTRLSWLELNNSQTGAAIVDTIKIIKELGEANKQATFQVKISTCDNTVKLASSDSKVVVGSTSIALPSSSSYDGGYLNQDITLTYHCDHKDTTDAVISVYTKYEHNSFVVRAITKANGQEIVWKSGYENDEVTLPVNTQLSISDAASASSKLTPVLYSTNNPSVILISDDRESFKVIASGIATLTASQAGNSIYEATSDTKTIKATEKQIQEIVWTRSFSHGLVIDDTIPLNAYVDTINAATSSRARSDAQTAKLVYTCPNANGVVEIIEGNKVHILGEGRTQITASVASDEYYEATSYTKSVYVRKPSSGCEPHYTYLQKDEEILFFEFDFNVPELNYVITLDPDSGVPDLLSFSVRGEYYKAGAEWYRGHVDAYQSSDGASWSYITTIEPEKGQTLSESDLPIDRNTTMIKFTRPSASWGYHYVEDVVVTRKQYLETASEIIDLGDVPVGSVRAGKIPISYSEMRTDLLITKGLVDETYNKLELDEPSVEIECGSFGTHDVDFKLKPTHVDDSWSQTVTIEDTISNKSITVTLVANIVQGSQSINWTTNSTINDAQDAPRLNATATSGLPVSYVLTCENNVASIENIGGKDTVMIHRPGSFTITASQAGDANYLAAPNVVKNFTVTNVAYVYTGEGAWENTANWSTGEKPTAEDNVIINGNVTINTVVEVNSMTIEQGSNVTLTVGGDLTVTNGTTQTREHYGNLHVEQEGKVQLNNGTLEVNDFILEAALGNTSSHAASGQVDDAAHLNVNGDSYFQMSFDPDGAITYGWYDFVVPFEVNISGGISRVNSTSDKVMVCGTDFLLMEFDEQNRANGGKGWRQISSGVLIPGKLYTITFDDEVNQNTFRFEWNGNTALFNRNSYAACYATGGDGSLNGWNGLGNGMLLHGHIADGFKMQAYDHESNTYDFVYGPKTFAVGSAFFIQVESAVDVDWTPGAESLSRPMFAPKQIESEEVDEFLLTLRTEGMERAVDALYFSASEDATETYVIGHDLLKMGTPTDSKVARMWSVKGGKKLCDVEVTLQNTKASTPLNFYAPKAGTYTIGIEAAPEDAELYMTLNGKIFWNLSMSPYTLDLTQGTTEGYGLRIMTRNQTTTDIEETEFSGQDSDVRKVLIDDVIYIVTPDGKMYDIVGKGVKF